MQCYMKLHSSVNTVTLNYLIKARNVTFVLTLGPVNLHTIQLLNKHLYRSVSYTVTEYHEANLFNIPTSVGHSGRAVCSSRSYFCVCGVQCRRGFNQTRSPFEGVQSTAFK